VRLTASEGRALLDEQSVDAVGALPAELCQALLRWAWLAAGLVDGTADEVALDGAEAVSRQGEQLAVLVAAVRGEPVDYVDPTTGAVRTIGRALPTAGSGREPTPWATGLAVLGFVAVVVAGLDQALTAVLRADYHWVWIPANMMIGCGLAPTVLLLRGRTLWRWIAHGIAIGLIASWLGLLITAVL